MDEALAITACRFVIGEVRGDDLPGVATEALVRGVDSPSLRELAGLHGSEVRDAAERFEAALAELGTALPTLDEALWRLVRKTATGIVSGEIDPYDGALWIWVNAAHRVEEEGDLRIFIGLASERQDHPEASDEINAEIVEAAKELLARTQPRRWLRLQARQGEPPVSRWTANGLRPVSTTALGISTGLGQALKQWAADFEATFGASDAESGFASVADAEAFVARGRILAGELQAELGDEWHVEFYPEPIRPPGVRVRAR